MNIDKLIAKWLETAFTDHATVKRIVRLFTGTIRKG